MPYSTWYSAISHRATVLLGDYVTRPEPQPFVIELMPVPGIVVL